MKKLMGTECDPDQASRYLRSLEKVAVFTGHVPEIDTSSHL